MYKDEQFIAYCIVFSVCVLALCTIGWLSSMAIKVLPQQEPQQQQQDVAQEVIDNRRPNHRNLNNHLRNRRWGGPRGGGNNDGDVDGDRDGDGANDGGGGGGGGTGTRKKLYEQRRLEQDAEREEAEEALRAEQEALDVAWMKTIIVGARGDNSEPSKDSIEEKRREKIVAMLSHIKEVKVARITTLSSKFAMTSDQVVASIREAEGLGLLTGVMDERGKYIHVEETEVDALRGFIKQRGRVTIEQLVDATKTQRLVDFSRISGGDR